MLTGIIKATRAHYAALQHRPAPDRVALDYCVRDRSGYHVYTAGTIHVKALSEGRRRMEMTKLINRLQSMYPEASDIEASWRHTSPIDGQRNASSNYCNIVASVANKNARVHYQTGRGTLCSLDNDASVRTPTDNRATVTCQHCLKLLHMSQRGGNV